MNICNIGPGHQMPLLGMGTWKLKGKECEQVVRMGLELGYRHIDTADSYENHQDIARAIRSYSRKSLWLTSKIYLQDLEASRVGPATERFLKELATDYLDLLLIHWPKPDMDLIGIIHAMLELREKGLVKRIGVSNFSPFHYEALRSAGLIGEIYNHQLELHPYLQRRKLYSMSKKAGIALSAYRPLAKGAFEEDPLLQEVGFRYGKSPSQVVLNWLVAKSIAVIPKASSLEHLQDNLESFTFEMSLKDHQLIDSLECGKRFCQPIGDMTFEGE